MIPVRYRRFLLLFFVFPILFFARTGLSAINWEEVKGEHFIVYFSLLDSPGTSLTEFAKGERFAKDVLRKAEQCYKRIADELGYQRYSKFWTWDKRVKIYVYPDHASFIKATNQPGWSKGMADYTNKMVVSYRWGNEKEFLDALLPHEIGHLIFRDFIGFKGEVPLWLDEGVAQWQEEAKRKIAKQKANELLKEGRLLSLQKLIAIDTSHLYQSMYGRSVHEFYVEAISLVDFLITRYGTDNFTNFCRQLRDGKSLNGALRFSYPTSIRSIDELEEKWIKYIQEE
jgi:hypothetical protein